MQSGGPAQGAGGFHEVGYAFWPAVCEDDAKQERRLGRLVKLGFVIDWKTMGGPTRDESAARGLQNRWRKALHLLCSADSAGVRALAASAPPQMRFTLLCFARVLEQANKHGALPLFNAWLDRIVLGLILDVCGDLVRWDRGSVPRPCSACDLSAVAALNLAGSRRSTTDDVEPLQWATSTTYV